MKKRHVISALVVIVGIAFQLWRRYKLWLYIPGVMMRLKVGPVAEHEEMVWMAKEGDDASSRTNRPNIVLILVDDLGFNDISFYRASRLNISTPNIDSLGRNGVSFTNAYAGHATCAPSRAALLTGRSASTVGYEYTPTHPAYVKILGTSEKPLRKGILHKELADSLSTENMTLPLSEVTIAKSLQQNYNYSTLMLGKWHLGEKNGPTSHGFDQSLGFNLLSMHLPQHSSDGVEYRLPDELDELVWASARYQVSKNGEKKQFSPKGYLTDYFAAEADRAISKNKYNPFFLYMALNAPHTPYQALKTDYDKLSHIEDELSRVYAAMIIAIDRAVGTVLDSLRRNNLEDDTIVIFTNDNGAPNWSMQPRINHPYRGWKGTFFEGGLHVPLLVQWPKVIQPATVVDDPVTHMDIFPTLMAAADFHTKIGTPAPVNPLCGTNLLPTIFASSSDREENYLGDRTFFWRSGYYKVVIHKNWKLQKSENPSKIWLYDLSNDPYEKYNLADAESHLVHELLKILNDENSKQGMPLWPSISETAIHVDKLFETNESLDDEYVYWPN